MYLGGNGFYWVTPMDPTGRYIEVRRRDGTEHWQGAPGEHYHSLTGEPGGLWRFRGMAPQQFFGVGFTAQGFDRNQPYRRMPGSFDPRAAFIFEGIGRDELIGDHPSLVLEVGAAGSELDRADFALGTPPHTLVLASSSGHSDAYQHVVEQINTSNSARPGGTQNPLVRADMVFLEYPNGGAVFSTSSIAWCGSLSYNNYTNNVSRITENVLRRFASNEPFPAPQDPRRPASGHERDMMNTARDEFLRRYATSPIHVPRLERFLAVYGSSEEDDAFCSRFIEWDRACSDADAARIVTEILSAGNATGQITRLSDDTVRGAIRWMSELTSLPVAERAFALRVLLTTSDDAAAAGFVEFLAGAAGIEDAQFQAAAEAWAGPRLAASGRVVIAGALAPGGRVLLMFRRVSWTLAVMLLCASPAAAQDATMNGVVMDESKAVLPGLTSSLRRARPAASSTPSRTNAASTGSRACRPDATTRASSSRGSPSSCSRTSSCWSDKTPPSRTPSSWPPWTRR